jgi:hypothetical protein
VVHEREPGAHWVGEVLQRQGSEGFLKLWEASAQQPQQRDAVQQAPVER